MAVSRRIILFIIVRVASIELFGQKGSEIHITLTCSAIVGSAFYNPIKDEFPKDYVGDYFYGDFCGGWIRRYDIATNKSVSFATGMGQMVDFQTAPDGTFYVLRKDGGIVYSITLP